MHKNETIKIKQNYKSKSWQEKEKIQDVGRWTYEYDKKIVCIKIFKKNLYLRTIHKNASGGNPTEY